MEDKKFVVLERLLNSRKFWLSVFGVLQALVLQYFDVPDAVWQAISTLVGILIVTIAAEDFAEKLNQ